MHCPFSAARIITMVEKAVLAHGVVPDKEARDKEARAKEARAKAVPDKEARAKEVLGKVAARYPVLRLRRPARRHRALRHPVLAAASKSPLLVVAKIVRQVNRAASITRIRTWTHAKSRMLAATDSSRLVATAQPIVLEGFVAERSMVRTIRIFLASRHALDKAALRCAMATPTSARKEPLANQATSWVVTMWCAVSDGGFSHPSRNG